MLDKDAVALMALGRLGSTHYSIDLTSSTAAHVKIINVWFQSSLNTFLERHPWKDYRNKETLVETRVSPTNNWCYEYTYSSNVQMPVSMGVDGYFHKRTVNESDKLRWEDMGAGYSTAWNAATAYVLLDVVSYLGLVYRRIVAGTTAGTPLADVVNWVEVGGLIHSDIKDADIEYTEKVSLADNPTFKDYIGKGLSGQLAKDIAPMLITNNFAKVQQVLIAQLDSAINEAVSTDLARSPLKREAAPTSISARWR